MQDFILYLWQQPAPPQGQTSGLMQFLFIGAAILVIYFMLIRPQSQQRKKQNNFSSNLKKGKKVVTVGGMHGTIAEINETTIDLIIAPKTVITVQRDSISMDMTSAAYAGEEKEK